MEREVRSSAMQSACAVRNDRMKQHSECEDGKARAASFPMSLSRRRRPRGWWSKRHCCVLWHPLSWVVVCLIVWPMDRISNASAYTLAQVRRADYATNCGLGFAGLNCDEVNTCEELDYCSGHGICQRGGFCICDPGWQGASCKQSNCPSQCSGHGSCAVTGGCVCDAGYTGIICNQVVCLGGGNCTGHGACLSGGICECEKGYIGGACDTIDVALKCSNNGLPDEDGNCKCNLWFTGPDCSLALCSNNCSDHGACDSKTGTCWCDPGWTAKDCSKQLCYNNCTGHGTCFEGKCWCQDGFSGDDCSIFPCLNSCSGNGACYNGTCACDHLWVGADCSLYTGYLLECPQNCTGRGSCMNSTCYCDMGWAGLDCASPVDCPGNCTGHGVCYNATCACDLGFSGRDCSVSHCLNNCTLHGSCTSNGTCVCDASFHGPDCSLPDLSCGTGWHGNCSGHGTCMDSATNQWWSGSSRLPDMWAWEEASQHLVRRDVGFVGEADLGRCISDFYGIPSIIASRVSMGMAGKNRVMQSNGVPEHFVIHNMFPLCEVSWSISVPLKPVFAVGECSYLWPLPRDVLCPKAYPLPRDSPIGYALNGLPIWGPLLTDGSNAVEGAGAVPCYGHASRSGMWHYHHPLFGCNMAANQETLLGFALDGYAIYGPLAGSKADVDAVLDRCNGRALQDGTYQYHVRTLAQVDESVPYQDDNKDPRDPMGKTVHTNWNYVLGCFSGEPTTSLGLRQIVAPLITASDGWTAVQDNSAFSTSSLADQLGLTARVGICMCDAGWVGPDCRTAGCLNNCSSHGLCRSNETMARCHCDHMWEGEDCSRRVNTTCDVGCSGHGTCLWAGHLNASCVCDPGWQGRHCEQMMGPSCPFNCSGHGSCFNKTCVCDHMYGGIGCESPSAYALNLNATVCWQWIGNLLTNNSCSGQGSCFNGTCLCDAGWLGVNCSVPFVPDPVYVDCFNNCSFHGACSFVFDPLYMTYNGTCTCDAGFSGPDCSIDWGAYQCQGNCSAHGTCVNKTCICDPDWTGLDCNQKWFSPIRLCPMNCSNHGSCFNGTCTCDLGWHGINCSLPNPCPADCSGHGVCSLGNCTCDPEWAGDDCSHSSYCPGYLPALGVNCSGHGICLGGNCSCDLRWGGLDCSIEGCINSCSNNGICRNGTCDCYVGFIGEDCSMGPYDGECPSGCSGHGACSIVERIILPYEISDVHGDGMLSGSIGCVCDEGWESSDCSIRSCPNECSRNGACAQNGSCYCYQNWGGEDCSIAWCPNECNNHGTCVGGRGCLCDMGYDGLDCGVSSCPGNCTGRGVCVHSPGLIYADKMFEDDAEKGYDISINNTLSSCQCYYGWGGSDCSVVSCPLNCSFPNGFCNNGTCICDMDQGYYGRNCSERFGLVNLRTDGRALSPSYGIFEGGTIVTVRGTGFVSSDTMRCKFGDKVAVASLVQPNPPEMPYATCYTPGEPDPDTVFFLFSLDNRDWTQPDARIKFVYHGNGIVELVRWPTAPEQGGTTVTFFGINFQYALGVRCKFGTYELIGSYNIRYIEDPETGDEELEAQLHCPVPPLKDLNLPASAGNTVVLWTSMNMGQNWMRYEKDYFFSYFGLSRISPSFGPQQDQNTEIAIYGFNFYQGEGRKDSFPGFEYEYACVFRVPWTTDPVEVKSYTSTWTLVTAPPDGSRFVCKVPPGLVGQSGYEGPVEVGITLNPCIYFPGADPLLGCSDFLPYTTDPVIFYYVENTVDFLGVTLGPMTGGTTVTIKGRGFDRRDLTNLPRPYTHPPILCRWGTVVNQGIFNLEEQSVTCVSPACTSPPCAALQHASCPDCTAPVQLEVALNGQDFTSSRVEFSYYNDPKINKIHPTLGPVLGGTVVTVESSGFPDPCIGCLERKDCDVCGSLVVCQFKAKTRVKVVGGECVKIAEDACDPTRILCPSPEGRELRGSVVSLSPFYVSLSVSVNNQQFFPLNVATNEPYTVDDTPCSNTRTAACSFLFKFFELPILTSVYPTAISGNGGGRVTVVGVNFLNENGLRCRYGSVLSPQACISGASGDFTVISTPGLCVGAVVQSPIFISSDMVICGTVELGSMKTVAGEPVTASSVGISFNGGDTDFDTFWLRDESLDIVQDALQVYWVTSMHPTLGFMSGGTRVTVTGVNLEAVGKDGDNTKMRCRFGTSVVFPDPTKVPDPVDFVRSPAGVGGTIHCTSPVNSQSTGLQQVSFGICLLGVDCEYTGKARQAAPTNTYMPSVDHFTKSTQYLYYQSPQLVTLMPSLGPQGGSTHVTIKGTGFFNSPVLSCQFSDALYSTASTYVDEMTVICKTPAATPSQYSVEITLNGQQYSRGCSGMDESVQPPKLGVCWFYFYKEPRIVAIYPPAGINTGKTQLSLTIEEPLVRLNQIRCKFHAVHPADQERLAIEGLDMTTPADSTDGKSVKCLTPDTTSRSGERIMRTATTAQSMRGLTYVSLTWNGQQYGPFDETQSTQRFWFHDVVQAMSVLPSGGKMSAAQLVTLYGQNFLNVHSLIVKFGNLYLCAPGANDNSCPQNDAHIRNALSFINDKELTFTVPTSLSTGLKTLAASNNGQPNEYSTVTTRYEYFGETVECPGQCAGNAPAGERHGECKDGKCVCKLGYSGADCSVGPIVLELVPSSGLVKGGWSVTVIGRNIWNYQTPTTANSFMVMLDGRMKEAATKVGGCNPVPGGGGGEACEDKLVFVVPTQGLQVAASGITVEITVNGQDYTSNQRMLQIFGTPTISRIVPDGAYFAGNIVVTLTGTNFIDSASLRVRLGPIGTSPPCLSELCLRAVYVSSTQIQFTSKACLGNCNFGTSLLVQLALNGADYVDTKAYFRFLQDTEINHLGPRVGSTAGGTPVVITASNMDATTGFTCKFGDKVVSGSVVKDAGESQGKLLCIAPPSTKNETVPVSIALDGQTYTKTPDCKFESQRCFVYISPLKISLVYPTLGPVGGGTPITIVGAGFYRVNGVQGLCKFEIKPDALYTTPLTFVDPGNFKCLSPNSAAAIYDFRISGNGIDFEIIPFRWQSYKHPVLSAGAGDAVNPVGAPVIGGTSVTISGTGFINSADGIIVKFVDVGETKYPTFLSGKATFLSDSQVVIKTQKYPYGGAETQVSLSLNNGLDYSLPPYPTFQFYRTPTLIEIQPPLGPRLGETNVAVIGEHFVKLRSVAKCRFGDQVVPAVFDDTNVAGAPMFSCKSPPWPVPAWVNVEIAMDGQVFTNAMVIKFQYYGEFDVNQAVPAGGPKAGGTEITVNGVGMFMTGTYLSCFFGDGTRECGEGIQYPCYKAVPAAFRTATSVSCVSPSMPEGGTVTELYSIRVGLNGQFSQACPNVRTDYQCALKAELKFTYYDDVFITGISPNSGQVQGGTELTVYGSGFRKDLEARTRCMFTRCTSVDIFTSGANYGKFRSPTQTKCTGTTIFAPFTPGSVAVISSTMIRCMSPLASTAESHFTLFDISLNRGVTNQNFYGPLCQNGCPVMYFFYALPQIAYNSPSLGPVVGGTVVTVNGVGFIGTQNTAIRCKFGTAESTAQTTGVENAVQFLTDSTISCVAPPQAKGSARISISLNGLDSDFTLVELGAPYLYHEPPKLTGRPTPSAGPTSGGTYITITGTGFLNGYLQCKFWTTAAEGNVNKVVQADFLSSTSASCASPAVTQAQLVSISLSLNGQDFSPFFLERLYRYFPAPEVKQLIPPGGPAQSGGYTMVRGSNFLDTATILCRVGVVVTKAKYYNDTFVGCVVPQIQRKIYSKVVGNLGILPEVLSDSFAVYPVQGYPVEVSFDGQTFSRSSIKYSYYTTPQVDEVIPNSGGKSKLTTVAVLNGANFRNDFGGPFCRFAGVGATKAVFMSDRSIRCQVPPVPLGKQVLIEISINGQEYEDHNSATFSFMGEAPILQEASLSKSFDTISLQFDVDTDRGGPKNVGSFACGNILKWRYEDLSLPSSGLSQSQVLALGPSPTDHAVFQLLFGFGVLCRFASNKTATLITGANPTFLLGHPIWVKENVFRRGVELTYLASGNASISSPYASAAPVAQIASPSEIGRCDNLNVDAASSSGGLGRMLYFSWILDRGNSDITDHNLPPSDKARILTQLGFLVANFSGRAFDANGEHCYNPNCKINSNSTKAQYKDCTCNAINIPFRDFPQGKYTVQLIVSNWQNAQSLPSSISVIKTYKAIPTVTIDWYASRAIQVNGSVTFSGKAAGSTCNEVPPLLLFKWTVLRSSGDIVGVDASVTVTAKSLQVPKYTFLPGTSYKVMLSVTDKDGACIFPEDCKLPNCVCDAQKCCAVGTDAVDFVTATSSPVAKIIGGERSSPVDQELQLDGSGSFHPDYPGSRQPKLKFKWECKDTPTTDLGISPSGNCFSESGTAFGSSNEMFLMIPPKAMRAKTIVNGQFVDVIYDFSLNVSDDTTWTIATVRVKPSADNAPQLSVQIRDELRVYPPNLRMSIMSVVQSTSSRSSSQSLTYQWTTVTGDVDLTKSQYLLSPSSREPSLVIKPNVLTSGQKYCVRLTVTDQGKSGFGQVSFTMDNPPSGGVFSVTPTSGTSLETAFELSARSWQVDTETLPISYAFEYHQQGSGKYRIVQEVSQDSVASQIFPPGPASDAHVWALKLRISNIVGSETLEGNCNFHAGDCLIKVDPKVFASEEAMLKDLEGRTSAVQDLIKAGDPNGAINYVNSLLTSLNTAVVNRRRHLLAINNTKAAFRCGILAPQLYEALPAGGLVNYPSASSIARSCVAGVVILLSVPLETNDQCLVEMKRIYDVVLEYVSKGSGTAWASPSDSVLLQDLSDSISLGIDAVQAHYIEKSITRETTSLRIATLLTQLENITAVRSYGSIVGEAAKSLDSTKTRAKTWRIATPTQSASSRGWHRTTSPGVDDLLSTGPVVDDLLTNTIALDHARNLPEERRVYAGGRRLLTTTYPGATSVPALEGTFTQTKFMMPANVLPFVINKVGCSTASNGAQLCEEASVSVVATHFISFFNPHFYSEDSTSVIAPVMALQLQAFGTQEVIPVEGLKNDITFEMVLTRVPDSTQDVPGRHRVAACVWWNGTKWDTSGCMLDKIMQADNGGNDMIAICKCNHTSAHTVLDAPAGCDSIPYSTKLFDGCRLCGGDGSTCIGCDGRVASGKVLDGCGKCGGDNSTCSGCDGVPNSGVIIDECNVCGGDNSSCRGCDGISIHPYVTARFPQKKPKVFDNCKSLEFPFGVCGGCDASCKGCDGVPNSGKLYDKCGRCGEYTTDVEAAAAGFGAGAWYSRLTTNNCSLGLKQCASGFVADDCANCVQFGAEGAEVRNKACMGCNGKAGVFSYQYGKKRSGGLIKDGCGVCGGNDCSCIDCKGVVGGKARDDRCGICEGNNTCVDCKGIPYGITRKDVCGICGGKNDTEQCRGCDGKLYPLPLKPPRLDRFGRSPLSVCCPVEKIGCNDICGASVGCDGNCSTTPLLTDKCGVCGGRGEPNTGTCDCKGVPNGRSAVGCDGICSNPPSKIDMCGVCGGNNQRETGHCDCENVPFGRAIRDSAGVCCYLSDMGCATANQSRCFSGKTFDICNTCGGDGGTCVQTRPSSASRLGIPSKRRASVLSEPIGPVALAFFLAAVTLLSIIRLHRHV